MKETIKLAVVLSLYTVVACLALALVHGFTEPIIQKTKEENSKRALQSIFPEADSFESIVEKLDSVEGKIAIQAAHVAKKGSKIVGLTIQASGPTYSKATILMGITLEKKISGLKFLELLDTPSLGSKAADEPFIGQFTNKSIKDKFVAKEDVEAISGATITSSGVCAILKTAGTLIDKYMDEHLKSLESSNSKEVTKEENVAGNADNSNDDAGNSVEGTDTGESFNCVELVETSNDNANDSDNTNQEEELN